jgi:CTP synthase (UTP-ammonia lyase)
MSVTVAALGDRNPSFPSHREADAAIALAPAGVELAWLPTSGARAAVAEGLDGIWLMPGTPYEDEAAVMAAIRFAREEGVPILGTCGGFQHMAVEFARNVAGIATAGHTETDPDTAEPVVHGLGCSLEGEERTVTAVPGTRFAALAGTAPFTGMHFCSYGLNEHYLPRLEEAGMVSGPGPRMPASRRSSCPITRSTWRPSSSPRWAPRRRPSSARSSPPSSPPPPPSRPARGRTR